MSETICPKASDKSWNDPGNIRNLMEFFKQSLQAVHASFKGNRDMKYYIQTVGKRRKLAQDP